MVPELWYIEDTSDSNYDSGSDFDYAPDSHEDSDQDLCCLCFAFEGLIPEAIVVVLEPEEVVEVGVDIEMVVGIGLPPRMDKVDMA